jgi:hypothetical protein
MYRIGGFIMTIGSLTPLQQATPLKEDFSVNDVCVFVTKHSALTSSLSTSETHFTNDLGADFLDRGELMLAIEDNSLACKSRMTMSSRYKS